MQRVMIVGQPGSGKSTLARNLGQRTGLPVVHTDRIHWMPGWQPRPMAKKLALMRAAEARDAWIIEGNLSATWDTRLERADTVIVLLFPIWLRALRVAARTVRDYGRSRADLPDDCPECFDTEFWRYIWRTRHSGRFGLQVLAARAEGKANVVVLDSPRAVRQFLDTLGPDFGAQPA